MSLQIQVSTWWNALNTLTRGHIYYVLVFLNNFEFLSGVVAVLCVLFRIDEEEPVRLVHVVAKVQAVLTLFIGKRSFNLRLRTRTLTRAHSPCVCVRAYLIRADQ